MRRSPSHPDPHHHTTPAALQDSRPSRDLPATETSELCAGCVRCCTYITVEIDAPRAAWEYDQWIWALHHEGIELYLERPEKWFLHVETRCRQLNQAGRCSIHGRHPVLCREYDARTCERRQPLSDLRCWFRDAEAFELWLKSERPAHWARLATYRERQPHGIPVADARAKGAASGFIALADLAAPASSRRGRSA